MLQIIRVPPHKGGRPPVARTVLRDSIGEIVLTRRLYSHGENLGNTGGPRADAWIGLRRNTLHPLLILGRPGEWRVGWLHDIGPMWHKPLEESLRDSGYRIDDLQWTGEPLWPTTIMDRRIVLPGDDRWGKKSPSVAAFLREFMTTRNQCPDDQVWIEDAMILTFAPKADYQ